MGVMEMLVESQRVVQTALVGRGTYMLEDGGDIKKILYGGSVFLVNGHI